MYKLNRFVAVITIITMATLVSSPLFANGASEGSGGTKDKMYIPVVSKGLQHQFWQTVKLGSEDAAKKYEVDITFEGPASEADIQDQVKMFQNALAKKPSAVALAALDTNSVMDQLQEAMRLNIPIIGFDSGVPDAPAGSIFANASTDNANAAGLGAEKMFEAIKNEIVAATSDNPVTIVVLSQDANGESLKSRGFGFRDRMIKMIVDNTPHTDNDIRVQGNPAFVSGPRSDKAAVILDMVVSASPRTQDLTSSANAIFNRVDEDNIRGLFCSNEGSVVGVLAATNDGAQLKTNYSNVKVVGFDAGAAQKNAVSQGYFLGSITQDPYQIGFIAVELAYKAANGEKVSNVDTGAKFYNSKNMDQSDIAQLLYD